MFRANIISTFCEVTLLSFGLISALAIGCGSDDGDTGGTATGNGSGTATGTSTGTGAGTASGTGSGTGSGTATGTTSGSGTGTGSGTPGGMASCDPDPNEPCELCAAQACATEIDTCCAETGCIDLVRCALETGCAADPDPTACLTVCGPEIEAAGGVPSSGVTAAQGLGTCTVAAAEAASSGPCFECNQQFMN